MLTPQEYTVGIICPLEVEMSAVRYMLDHEHDPPTHPQYAQYIFGELSKHKVVIATLPINAQGKVFTAMAASDLRQTFENISHFLLVGIGGGVPTQGPDVRLGDVVISTPMGQHCGVVQYDLGKKQIDGFKRKGYLAAPAREWLQAIPRMQSSHRVSKSKISGFIAAMQARMQSTEEEIDPRQFMRPQSMDRLYKPDYTHPPQNQSCKNDDQGSLVERAQRELSASTHSNQSFTTASLPLVIGL